MTASNIFIPISTAKFDQEAFEKGSWIVILHALSFPPHAGLLLNGNYNSLTIKESELNVSHHALLKIIAQKKIKSIFIKVVAHPVFSVDHQKDILQEGLKKYGSVKNQVTCLTPLKNFFNEFYAMPVEEHELLFNFISRLNTNGYLEHASALHLDLKDGIELPFYNYEELKEKIKTEQMIFYNK